MFWGRNIVNIVQYLPPCHPHRWTGHSCHICSHLQGHKFHYQSNLLHQASHAPHPLIILQSGLLSSWQYGSESGRLHLKIQTLCITFAFIKHCRYVSTVLKFKNRAEHRNDFVLKVYKGKHKHYESKMECTVPWSGRVGEEKQVEMVWTCEKIVRKYNI